MSGCAFYSRTPFQLLPQIVINYRRHDTTGLQPMMMMLWASAGVPLGVYNIVEEFNFALRIQPQILTFLSLCTWIQCYYYGKVCCNSLCYWKLVCLVGLGGRMKYFLQSLRVKVWCFLSMLCDFFHFVRFFCGGRAKRLYFLWGLNVVFSRLLFHRLGESCLLNCSVMMFSLDHVDLSSPSLLYRSALILLQLNVYFLAPVEHSSFI